MQQVLGRIGAGVDPAQDRRLPGVDHERFAATIVLPAFPLRDESLARGSEIGGSGSLIKSAGMASGRFT